MEPGWFALIVSFGALIVATLSRRDTRARDRRDLYLKMHERLLDREQQEGRHILYRQVVDHEAARALTYDSGDRAKVNRALSTFDLLGYYLEADLVPREVILEEWGYSLFFIADHARIYLQATARGDWTKRVPRLQRLLLETEAWVDYQEGRARG